MNACVRWDYARILSCVTILYMPKRIYAMHFIVACLGVCLCDFAYVPGVDCVASPNPTGFLLSWCLSVRLHLVFVCVTSPALCGIFSAGTYISVWLCLPHDSSRRG